MCSSGEKETRLVSDKNVNMKIKMMVKVKSKSEIVISDQRA